MAREIAQIRLEVGDDLGRFGDGEVLPVLCRQRIARREVLLRHEHELRKFTGLVDFDDPHAEVRRGAVLRVERDERLVGARGVLIAELLEVELAEVVVDEVFVAAVAVRREVRRDGVGASDVRETQTQDAESVGDASTRIFVFGLSEVVSGRDLVVEQRDVLVQRLFVQLLLVERPAELVERELVEPGRGAALCDRAVGFFGVDVAASREEVLRAPKPNLIYAARVRVLGDQSFGYGDRLVGSAELVEGARLLVEHPVVVLVVRIGVEDAVVERDRLERAAALLVGNLTIGQRELVIGAERDLVDRGCAGFEYAVGFKGLGSRAHLSLDVDPARRHHGARARGGEGRYLCLTEHPVLLFELQICEPPHRLGCERRVGIFLEKAPVSLHGLVEPVFDADVGRVRLESAELGERSLVGARAGEGERGCDYECCGRALHHPTSLNSLARWSVISRLGRSCPQTRSALGSGSSRADRAAPRAARSRRFRARGPGAS